MDELNTLYRMNQGRKGVDESVNDYLWHGSRHENKVLVPRQANDTGGKEESNKNAIYATPSAKVAIAMGLTTPGSDTGMFPNDPQMILFKGGIRKGQMVYLHKVPKDLFIKHNAVRVVNLNPCYPSCGCYLCCTYKTKMLPSYLRCTYMLLLLSALYINVTLVICVVHICYPCYLRCT